MTKPTRVSSFLTGFAEQNQQLRANHPTLGPDGLIYVAGGLRGGSVKAIDARYERQGRARGSS